MAYLDWNKAEDKHIETQVAREIIRMQSKETETRHG